MQTQYFDHWIGARSTIRLPDRYAIELFRLFGKVQLPVKQKLQHCSIDRSKPLSIQC
ncbi:MAG: hypothetical protein WBD58_05090 [Geitlerinemataceae cyanobacterium]